MRRALVAAVAGSLAACHSRARTNLVPATLTSGGTTIPYPPDLYNRHLEGQVLLYLVVDSTGQVIRDSTRVATSSGQAAFDSAALAAAPRLRFSPAKMNGVAVTAPIQIPIRFRLPDSTASTRRDS